MHVNSFGVFLLCATPAFNSALEASMHGITLQAETVSLTASIHISFFKLSTAVLALQYCSIEPQDMAPPLEKDGKRLVYTSTTFIIATTIAVAVRILAKQKTKSHFARDDSYIVAALVAFWVYNAVIIASK